MCLCVNTDNPNHDDNDDVNDDDDDVNDDDDDVNDGNNAGVIIRGINGGIMCLIFIAALATIIII